MDIIFWIAIFVLGVAVTYDIRSGRIPNWLTFPAMAVALACHVWITGVPGLLSSAYGLLIGFAIFLVLYLLGGMGAGDVKLMAAVGAFLGPKDVLLAALFTAIAGGIYAITLLIVQKNNRRALGRLGAMAKGLLLTGRLIHIPAKENEKATPLRYGVAIGVGALAVLVQRII